MAKWSPERVAEARRLRSEGFNDEAIGRELGVRGTTIRYWIGSRPKVEKIPGKKHAQIVVDQKARAAELRSEGITDVEIAQRLDVSHSTIRKWLGRRTIPQGERRKEAMRLRIQEGLINSQIAQEMGVGPSVVAKWIGPDIVNTKRGKAVPDRVYNKAVELRKTTKMTNSEIAHAVGVHPKTIYNWMGVNPHTKPNQHDVGLHSRAMYLRECGYNISEVSEIMGIPRSTVAGWVKGYGCYGQPTE